MGAVVIDLIGMLSLVFVIAILTLTIHKVRAENAKLKKQIHHARTMILEDRQWLGHNKIARAICTRHANLLHTAWRAMVHQDQSNFRKEIGLEPDFKNEGKNV